MDKKYLTFLFLFVIGVTLLAPYCNVVNANGLPEGWREEIQDQTKDADAWAQGTGGGLLGGITKNMLSGVIAGVSIIIYTITQGFMHFSKILLTWVTSPGFISVHFTHNSFVDIGWGMVRDLTNILIVLGLVVIALATILRIESYQMKKTLPLLLIVALLINFTPMLCGLVIDGSNIVMDHFLKGGQALGQNYFDQFGSAWSKIWSYGDSPSSTLATGLILVGVGLFSGIIFLLFAALFLLRYIALWILVILSPLAFFCYIFPGTKKMWNQWSGQFIQWCFIGIPAAFTIHLANKMTELMLQDELLGEMSSMGKIMGYMVPVAFLAGGFLMSLQTGAMGASFITTRFRKGTTAAGRAATGIGLRSTGRAAKAIDGEIKKIRSTYQLGRTSGLSRTQAASQTAKTYWHTRAQPAMKAAGTAVRRPDVLAGRAVLATGKGILSATWNIAAAGTRAGLGIKGKGSKICPNPSCKKVIAKSAKFCPHCGYDFE